MPPMDYLRRSDFAGWKTVPRGRRLAIAVLLAVAGTGGVVAGVTGHFLLLMLCMAGLSVIVLVLGVFVLVKRSRPVTKGLERMP